MRYTDELKNCLRNRPLMPPLPEDAEKDWTDVDSGIKMPLLCCSFSGCSWALDDKAPRLTPMKHLTLENAMTEHLLKCHRDKFPFCDDDAEGQRKMYAYHTGGSGT